MPTQWIRWPANVLARFDGEPVAFGGDYNPEQWDESVWPEDVRLMREAGVNLVTVGVFAWSTLQPAPDRWNFGWLDRVLDLLHAGGIAVDLATATASPPPWLTTRFPEVLPVDHAGHTMSQGGRQAWSPSSPVYREHSLALVERLAERYGEHPALALWHVSNELGGHNSRCYDDATAVAFRDWLARRYHDSLDELNVAWTTAAWSQTYSAWEEILPPRLTFTDSNPTQVLDFDRFSSDQLREQLRAETAVLRRVTPEVPVTTNLVLFDAGKNMAYSSWTGDLDLIASDHYLSPEPDAHVELSFSADRARGLSAGAPWLLMETATGATSWRPVNPAKRPGQLRRDVFAHLARGADGICFFQWRAAGAGAERFHSAMLPHAGPDSRKFREVAALGTELASCARVRGSRVVADCALLFSEEAWWAAEREGHPHNGLSYAECALRWYRSLWDAGITADVVPASADLSGYRLILVPMLYLVSDPDAAAVARAAAAGATVVVTYFSGIVDPLDRVRLGGYPGAFRELLGIRVEEFAPLTGAESVKIDGVTGPSLVSTWHEEIDLVDAVAEARYVSGDFAGGPAVTRATRGAGDAWYVGVELDTDARAYLVAAIATRLGLAERPVAGLDVVTRRSAGDDYLFVINHGDTGATVAGSGTDLLDGSIHKGLIEVPAGGVRVVRSPR
ncbi:beta-galactosidase [Rugosimonospora africana]|uniref:Beta-galactosidase n=1 Tax=Rugosimonospora africana TaxID=556532 RepID=A0A8J3QYR5_9ACTN|nr:beta-galactosidase [Rugosimonospora africana]GIH18607.1 beta-galactosidase [Rugosimonospora africana]